MGANTFGARFRITTFGESHGPAIGVVIDGCPAGVPFDEAFLRAELARRRPGTSEAVSARQEKDVPEVLSGVYEGRTLGTPIAIVIRNEDMRSADYVAQNTAGLSRPGHADETWRQKFGHVDPRGGGRASGRETATRVIGGAVAAMVLRAICPELRVEGTITQIGPHDFRARTPAELPREVTDLLVTARENGQSYGGTLELTVTGAPAGLGQPVFHKLKADLASALLGIGATSGIEIGDGFAATEAEGSSWHRPPSATGSPYGGIQGGISTGGPLTMRLGFKPTSSVLEVAKKGRHDPCIVPRALPVAEAMARLVVLDHFLWSRTDRLT